MFLPYIHLDTKPFLSKFWSFFSVYSFFLLNLYFIILFSVNKQPFQIIKNSFYSVSLHIYTAYLYTKICKSCSRNFTKHIQVVPPEYVPYSSSNMIHIFFPFFVIINYKKLEYSSLPSFFVLPVKAAHHLL